MNTATDFDTHAAYTVADTNEWHEIETNGNDLDEIISDMLDFWNGAPDLAEKFDIDNVYIDGDTTRVDLVGKVYDYTDGVIDEEKVNEVTVQITAEPIYGTEDDNE